MEKDDVVVQNGELFGKERAELRNEQLVQLIRDWEKERDKLLDEISHSQGQVDLLEKLVKESYEKILEVNKEEQAKEQELIDYRFDEIRKLAEVEEEKVRAAEVVERHKKKQSEVKTGARKGKLHPSDRGRDLADRKDEARKKKKKKE
jgi:hypothetical protein